MLIVVPCATAIPSISPDKMLGITPFHCPSVWSRMGCLAAVTLALVTAAAELKEFRLNNVPLTLEEVTSEVEVQFQSMRFNLAQQVWNVDVTVSNRAGRVLPAPLALLVDSFSGTSGPIQPDGVDDNSRAYYDLSILMGGRSLAPDETTPKRTLTLGPEIAPPSLVTRVYSGLQITAATLGVTRSLDAAGQPLPGVSLHIAGPVGQQTQISDSISAVVSFGQEAGEHVVRFSAEGYLSVWRRPVLSATATTVVPSPRLTLRSAHSLEVTPLGGVLVGTPDASVRFDWPPGVVPSRTILTITPLTGQTLPAFTPLGWSPLQAFCLEELNGVCSTIRW